MWNSSSASNTNLAVVFSVELTRGFWTKCSYDKSAVEVWPKQSQISFECSRIVQLLLYLSKESRKNEIGVKEISSAKNSKTWSKGEKKKKVLQAMSHAKYRYNFYYIYWK